MYPLRFHAKRDDDDDDDEDDVVVVAVAVVVSNVCVKKRAEYSDMAIFSRKLNCCRIPPADRQAELYVYVSSRSTTVVSLPYPARPKWTAVAQPTGPPPTMTNRRR